MNIRLEALGVSSIRVFGSSITNRCDPDSDLDLCIEWNFDCYDKEGILVPQTVDFMKAVSVLSKGNCDVVHYQYLDGTVVADDARGGVVVYVHDAESKQSFLKESERCFGND